MSCIIFSYHLILDMFDILFGWSKASKCKKAIKSARCRLRLLTNKRQAIVRQLRKDLAELIQSGHEETAFNRIEQLIEDESLVAAYELLYQFCQFILAQLSYIRRNKDCPNEINEAVSSLIFASARCGDLPELCAIRKLFGKRYGDKFVTVAIELLPGNLVNKQLKENLCGTFVPDDLKYRMMDEIARDNCLQQQVLAIQYYPDWQQLQVKDNKGCQVVENDIQIKDTNAGSKVHPSEIEEIKSDDSYISKTGEIFSSVQKCPPYILRSPLQKKLEKKEEFPLSITTSGMQNKKQRMALACSAERVSLPSYPEETSDYVDDIEEFRFSVSKEGACQDQMLFKFRSSGLSRRHKTQNGCNEIKEVTSASKGSYASTNVSNPRTNVSLPIETGVPYSRAMTMPQERDRNSKDKILRTYSCPYQNPNHVHPKLPNYDDIAAKFTALKREQLQNKK